MVQNMSLPKVPLPVTPSLRAFINGQEVDVNRANAALQRRWECLCKLVLVQDRCFKSVDN
ncbi:hypothetical protein ACNKHR_24225 [Shigella flexneri]